MAPFPLLEYEQVKIPSLSTKYTYVLPGPGWDIRSYLNLWYKSSNFELFSYANSKPYVKMFSLDQRLGVLLQVSFFKNGPGTRSYSWTPAAWTLSIFVTLSQDPFIIKQFIILQYYWKGTVSRDFVMVFFHQTTSPIPVRHAWKGFRFFRIFEENKFKKKPVGAKYTRETRLHCD
jgi:hypothetical protein